MQSAEYLVVLTVVGRAHGRERERIYNALLDRPQTEIDQAIESLDRDGVIALKGKRVHASPALKRLDELGLIGI